MDDTRNLITTIVLTMAILFGYQYFFVEPEQLAEQARQEQLIAEAKENGEDIPTFDASETTPGQIPEDSMVVALDRDEVLTNRTKITIDSPRLQGSIALKGARFDDLTLPGYKATLDEDSADVALLNPEGTDHAYYAEFGWGIVGAKGPDRNSVWTANKPVLEAGDDVTLTWDNDAGLLFTRTISLDENYMFTVKQKITNSTNADVKVAQYGRLVRKGRPEGQALYILHEGPIWSLDEGIREFSYSDLEDMKKGDEDSTAKSTDGGWVGITDKFWLMALIPDRDKDFNVNVFRRGEDDTEKFYADYIHLGTTLAAGSSYEEKTRMFAGAKVVSLLDHYTEEENVKLLNYSIDWGMFYFLTKPIYYLLEILFAFAGNFGVAILMLTAIVKLALFPLANKGYKSMNKMKVLQPKMKALKEKFGDDRTKMQQATMELYKKEKVNPVSGCLPMFLQFPVFFALYKVLYVTIDMRHAPFFGWIKDLSGPDTMLVSNLFGLLPWEPTGFLALGILPVFMGFTMWLQMQMNPSSGDPMQRKIMLFMPIVFTFMLSQFSVGLVIYWTFSNILGILQQWILIRRADPVPQSDKA